MKKTNEYPVLLLDDVFSELDIESRNRVLSIINKDVQVFITSTDIKYISSNIIKNSKIFKIEKCKVS
ncbi:dNA replication and repair protein RecF [Clostridium sp. CAG:1193]|nr:dNA replication and repair protein RecF [Clostridium sp. CAG:1193]